MSEIGFNNIVKHSNYPPIFHSVAIGCRRVATLAIDSTRRRLSHCHRIATTLGAGRFFGRKIENNKTFVALSNIGIAECRVNR